MPSALEYWRTELVGHLDELEAVHASATGLGAGRRWGTTQLNGQLFVALVAQFQAYARTLHDDALSHLRGQSNVAHQLAVVAAVSRFLDKGNPSPWSLGQDFGKLGMEFEKVIRQGTYGASRLQRLDAAVALRNGIAHGDARRVQEAARKGARPTLHSYRSHRRALNGLVSAMSRALAEHLRTLTGSAPW